MAQLPIGLSSHELAGSALEATVLPWKIDDICNENLLKDKVHDIPDTFSSRQELARAQLWPTVEELRASLHSEIERAEPYQRPIPIAIRDVPYSNSALTALSCEIPGAADLGAADPQAAHPLRPMQIICLSCAAGTAASAVQPAAVRLNSGSPLAARSTGTTLLLALVRKVDVERGTAQLVVWAPQGSPLRELLMQPGGNDAWAVAQILGGGGTPFRVWSALQSLIQAQNEETSLMKEVLPAAQPGGTQLGSEAAGATAPAAYSAAASAVQRQNSNDDMEAVAGYCSSKPRLNDSQKQAVLVAARPPATAQRQIHLIQGPPGTGKTSTIVRLLSVLAGSGLRVLVCAPTNVAMAEVAQRSLALVQQPGPVQFVEFLREEGVAPPAGSTPRVLCSGDLALVASADNEKLDFTAPAVAALHVASRARRLLAARMWTSVKNGLHDVLADRDVVVKTARGLGQRPSQVQSPSSTASTCNETSGGDSASDSDSQPAPTPWHKRLAFAARPFLEAAASLCQDLPSRHLSLPDRQRIAAAASAVVELQTRAGAAAMECPTAQIVQQCDHVLGLLRWLPALPAILARTSEAALRCMCIADAALVFCTVSGAGSGAVLETSKDFNAVLVDEAAQLVEAEACILLAGYTSMERLIMVGDPKQLPSTVMSRAASLCGYGRSLFERLATLGHPVTLLDTQYRMHPTISLWPGQAFYEGQVLNGPNVVESAYGSPIHSIQPQLGALAFVDVDAGVEERTEGGGSSVCNRAEAAGAVQLLRQIHAHAKKAALKVTVGVISPYSRQVELLGQLIKQAGLSGCDTEGGYGQARDEGVTTCGADIEVRTVDGFQGREMDVIIFSAVRANAKSAVGFLSDRRRLNVAITRARFSLWVLGHATTLARGDETWSRLITHAKLTRAFAAAHELPDVHKAIQRCLTTEQELRAILQPGCKIMENAIWPVSFSKNVRAAILAAPSEERAQVMVALRHLAQGRFRHARQLKSNHARSFEDLIRVQRITSQGRLVWSVDLDHLTATQVIKVWDYLKEGTLPQLLRRLEASFRTYTPEALQRCMTEPHALTRGVKAPRGWPPNDSFRWFMAPTSGSASLAQAEVGEPGAVPEESSVEDAIRLMKFWTLDEIGAQSLASGRALEQQMELNEKERIIVQFPGSVFILGRSGTGKTTVIVARVLETEQKWIQAKAGVLEEEGLLMREDGGDALGPGELRQLVLTASPRLCKSILGVIRKTRATLVAAAREEAGRPALLDNVALEEDLDVDADPETQLGGQLPGGFSALSPSSWPLVTTFYGLLDLYNADLATPFLFGAAVRPDVSAATAGVPALQPQPERLGATAGAAAAAAAAEADTDSLDGASDSDDEGPVLHNAAPPLSKAVLSRDAAEREVTFEAFTAAYWPHFSQESVKVCGSDAAQVWAEIQSCIKGSEGAVQERDGRLSAANYIALAQLRSSEISEGQRRAVYSLFLQYERQRRRRGEWDLAGYTCHVFQQLMALQLQNRLPVQVHTVSVDEVQDLTQAQIMLLRFLCPDPGTSFLLAGDTAQTIAHGVNFRFQDIRALFYRWFLGQQEAGASTAPEHAVPDTFQLSENFRTHMGIVQLAQSVVNLITAWFPKSIDKLSPEISSIRGELPAFLEAGSGGDALTQLFEGGSTSAGPCEFGADQAILVPTDAAKKKLEARVGKRALVFTVLECKGLEFQDVLVYNFFTESLSTDSTKWRVVYEYMRNHGLLSAAEAATSRYAAPAFDDQRHHGLCSELKQLYVLLTRTKQSLLIFEERPESAQPMLDLWRARGLVRVRPLDDALKAELRARGRSTPEQYAARAAEMLERRHFDYAARFFELAGNMKMVTFTQACKLRHEAQALARTAQDKVQAHQRFKSAGNLFASPELQQMPEASNAAVQCYCSAHAFEEAARTCTELCQPPRWADGGELFRMARNWPAAADAYSKAGMHDEALTACVEGEAFVLGEQLLAAWEAPASSQAPAPLPGAEKLEKLKGDFLMRWAAHCHKRGDSEGAQRVSRMFPDSRRRRRFLQRNEYFDEIIELEKSEGNWEAAAHMCDLKADLEGAAELYEEAGHTLTAAQRLLQRAVLLLCPGGLPLSPTDGKFSAASKAAGKLLASAHRLCSNGSDTAAGSGSVDRERSRALAQGMTAVLEGASREGGATDQLRRLSELLARQQQSEGNAAVELLLATYAMDAALACLPLKQRVSGAVETALRAWPVYSSTAGSLQRACQELARQSLGARGLQLLRSCELLLGVSEDAEQSWVRIVWAGKHASWLPPEVHDALKRSTRRRCEVSLAAFANAAQTHWQAATAQKGYKLASALLQLPGSFASPRYAGRESVKPAVTFADARGEMPESVQVLLTSWNALQPSPRTTAAKKRTEHLRRQCLQQLQALILGSGGQKRAVSVAALRLRVSNEDGGISAAFASHTLAAAQGSFEFRSLETAAFAVLLRLQLCEAIRLETLPPAPANDDINSRHQLCNAAAWLAHGQRGGSRTDASPPVLYAADDICSALLSLPPGFQLRDKNMRSLSVAAFVGLLEAAVVLGCAGATAIHSLVLPASLALSYLASPADGAGLLDALLEPRFQPESKRLPAYIRGRLAALGASVAELLCNSHHGAANWISSGQNVDAGGAASSPSYAARLLIALATCAINGGDGEEAKQMRCNLGKLAARMQSKIQAMLPLACQSMLVRLQSSALRSGFPGSPPSVATISKALQQTLAEMGDSMFRLRRPKSSPLSYNMRWARQLPLIQVQKSVSKSVAEGFDVLSGSQGADAAGGSERYPLAPGPSAEAGTAPMAATAAEEEEAEGAGAELQAVPAPEVAAPQAKKDEAVLQLPSKVKEGSIGWLAAARRSLAGERTRAEVLCRTARRAFETRPSLGSWAVYCIVKTTAPLQAEVEDFIQGPLEKHIVGLKAADEADEVALEAAFELKDSLRALLRRLQPREIYAQWPSPSSVWLHENILRPAEEEMSAARGQLDER